ncbi:hypothetical protein B0O99DRAFT_699808, partial [Bisporella sp. PMI_857]
CFFYNVSTFLIFPCHLLSTCSYKYENGFGSTAINGTSNLSFFSVYVITTRSKSQGSVLTIISSSAFSDEVTCYLSFLRRSMFSINHGR